MNDGTHQAVCATCSAINSGKAAHEWNDWVVTKVATTTAEGEEKRECKQCSAVETRAIAKLSPTPTSTPTAEPEDDGELIIEPWMRESKNLGEISISLRCEPEESKENKNIYALNEKVTYYIDYKNGTGKTTKKVTIYFEIPLDATVVDADGGKVDGNTITWTFPDGLDKSEAGTKVVVLKYISLGKSSVKSKTIYPVADIYESSKIADSSAVVNIVFKDTKTEIVDNEHYPYMHGDAEADTFRPDDGITRAEVAQLVNFYLLRAPAKVDSKTQSGFSDVKKTHELFTDIIEATRPVHTYKYTSDATELAIED